MSTSELSPLLNTNDVESLGAPNHGNNNKAPGLMDNVAKLGSIALAVFGVLAYLGWGLSLGFAEDIIEQLASFFGVLSPLQMPPHDMNVLCLSFFCFCVGAVNLLSLKRGKDEKPGAIIAREDINMVTYGALSATYILAIKSGTLSGSGPTFWTVFATVQFLAHYKIVSGNMGGIRNSTKDNLFKGTIGNVDLVNSVMFVMYGVMLFLSMGLNLEGLHGIMSSLMSLFGMLEPSPPAIAKSLATVFGGACGLGVAALNLPGFAGAAEDKDYAQVRRFASVAFWAASVIGMSSFPESGSFYSVWVVVSLIMALLLK